MKLTTRDNVYPNGQPYITIMLDGCSIGHAEVVEGGYLPHGMRKVRSTIQEAAAALVLSSITQLRSRLAEEQRWLKELEGLA